MTAGFFAPLPSARTGVADYAAALLAALQKRGNIGIGALQKRGDVRIDARKFDVALYHIGNNQLHAPIYDRAIEWPGVVVLHDAVLQHFFLGRLDEESYADEFVYNYGEWTRSLAEELWRDRARSGADPRYFAWPMLKRIASTARAVIVHNPAAAEIVKRHVPEAQVIEIPHLFIPPKIPSSIDTLRFRNELGLTPKTLLVGMFGHQRETKRLPVVLRALDRAWRAGADVRLLIAGSFVSSDLERSLVPWMSDPRILRRDYLPEPEFWRYASAVDMCINLRYPTAAETSGIAIRLMGIGKAVVFSAGDEIARIPQNACLRVEASAAEEEILAGYIVWLARDRGAAEEIGRRAAAHIQAHHAIDNVADQYWKVLSCSRACSSIEGLSTS